MQSDGVAAEAPRERVAGAKVGRGLLPAVAEENQLVQLFDLEYFDKMDNSPNDWRDHNTVLKYIRDTCESKGLTWAMFSNTEAHDIPVMFHHDKGTEYFFPDESNTFLWRWQDMIKQIRDADRKRVVQGPEDRSRGLVGCSLKQSELYDHTRHHVLFKKGEGPMKFHWHFLLHREDGSVATLKPSHSTTKIGVGWKEPERDVTVPKKGGMGGSDGPGTFQMYLKKGVDDEVSFNALRTTRIKLLPRGADGWLDQSWENQNHGKNQN